MAVRLGWVALLLLLAGCVGGSGGRRGERPLGHAGRRRASETRREAVEQTLRDYGYEEADFEPAPDRWRIGLPRWDRGKTPSEELTSTDSPYALGRALNPYRQNVLKGDYPLLGDHFFLVLTAISDTVFEVRDTPTPSAISTAEPRRPGFFGSGRQRFLGSNLVLSFEFFEGLAAFKPPDFLVRITPVVNGTLLDVEENNAVDIDVREGTRRTDGHVGLQEAFLEKHLADLSANYDFVSLTAGIQPFVSDFRGFLFSDNNLGVKLTFNLDNNRTQANVAGFHQLEKDTNSELNDYEERGQLVLVANVFRQDFVWPGYTLQGSVHYNRDRSSARVDDNGVPVRPPILGSAAGHDLDVVYLGLAGDGHLGRLNLTHEYFFAFGEDSLNPLAGREVEIEAHLAFLELSVDFDWLRARVSGLWTSGDDDAMDGTARGFDAILDNPDFAGGPNSWWIRQNVRLLGVGLVHRLSPLPTLRSSKLEGQANFVNPGILFLTAGLDAELTAELRATLNVSYLRFSETGALEPFVNQNDIGRELGWEINLGAVYRPWLTNNVQLAGGAAVFLPGDGFADLYESGRARYAAFFQLTLTY